MPVLPSNNSPNNKKGFSWGRFSKTLSFWILLILIPVAFVSLTSRGNEQAPTITYSEYARELQRDNVSKVSIQDGVTVTGEFREKVGVNGREVKKFNTRLPVENSDAEVERLRQANVQIEAQAARPSVGAYLLNFLPYFLLIGFWIFLFKQMQAGGAQAFSFRKSQAKLLPRDTPKVTFADVAGAHQAQGGLQESISIF